MSKPTALPRIRLLAATVALVLAAVVAASLWQLRRDAIAAQTRELAVLSLALADELDRGLQGLELMLQATRLDVREGRIPPGADEAAQELHERVANLRIARKLWIAAIDGHVLAASAPPPILDASAFAPRLDALDDESAALSRPFDDMTAHETSVALALRFVDAAGQPGGFVLAAMPAEALRGAFTTASPAADARMAVYRADGLRLAGALEGGDWPGPAPAGRARLVAEQKLARMDLRLVLTRDLDAVLAPWREVARFAIGGLVLMLAGLVAMVLLIERGERRRAASEQALQTRLARSNRLESLGTLAGGVAHDFNNVLAAVLGFAEMARESAPAESAQARQLDRVLQAALRGKSLVERILAFSRAGARKAERFEAQPVIAEVLALLSASLPENVRVASKLDASGALLEGDPTQLFEAAMNLCRNAIEAMGDGGTLTVSLRTESLRRARLTSHGQAAPGDHLVLQVADEGRGIEPATMERMFEPFFTTRGARAGTGLGLAVVHGVVDEFGGAIDVQSTPGQGARFTLWLPRAQGLATRAAPPAAPVPGQGQTLLVVDDEPALVELAEEMLAGLGYEPVGFQDPQAALAALRAKPGRFDAVVTDELMPGLTGTELTQALRAFAPTLPVLLVSGYGGPQLAARAAQAGVSRVLAKPLQRAELAEALAQALRQR